MSFLFAPTGRGGLNHRRPANLDRFWFGTTYYPEHCSLQVRALDADRMAATGMNVVRMAEFAGDLMEPSEGEYDFSLFDETVDRLGAKGVRTILCTPTATPPRWLTFAHPEMLRVNANGVRMQHGSRQHACHASPVLSEWSRRITRTMAEHYRDNPHVIGWQTDNELYCHFSECHCPNCQLAFQEYLRERYDDDVEKLNRAWGNSFWALTFRAFEEIETPRESKPAYENPSHRLEYSRYLSALVSRFQHEQVVILREIQPRWFVTHNGCFSRIDYRGNFTADLDFLGYDSYPFFDTDVEHRRFTHAFNLDRARGWSGNFIILEQQAGPGGQRPYFHDTPEPGEMRRMMFSSIARGADSFLHFRWRTCRFGAEEYWCGVLDHDNVPRRRYEELAQEGRDIAIIGQKILGTGVRVDAAVACCSMDQNEAHASYTLGLPEHNNIAQDIHHLLNEKGMAVGCIHPADDLAGLRLLVIPHWPLFDPAWVPGLEKWVHAGGCLVIGARCATRDLNNQVVAETLPGCLAALAGVSVEEYGKQNRPDQRPLELSLNGQRLRSEHWYELLSPTENTETLATWESRHLTGKAGITRRRLGTGSVIYVGTYLTAATFNWLMPTLIDDAGLAPLWPDAPEGVEVVVRENSERRLWFFINHHDGVINIPTRPAGKILIGEANGYGLSLPRNGVTVIETT